MTKSDARGLARMEREGSPRKVANIVAASVKAELVYAMILDRPVLTWEVTLPLSLGPPAPSARQLWISALTGRILRDEETVMSLEETRVFSENPRATPEATTVTLTGLRGTVEGAPLVGSRSVAYSCVTEATLDLAPWFDENSEKRRECYPTHQVAADADGNYFVPLPNVVLDEDNKDPDDLYAELAMYYHAERFFEFVADLGIEDTHCEQSSMVANFHYLDPAPKYPELNFGPLNNAYYTSQCDPQVGPTMVFGQGSEADFAYDGDVVYHELGHGMVRLLTPAGLTEWRLREDGSLRDARAINESIADYHSLMITEDPYLGDYVGFYWTAIDRPYVRSALNENRCPNNNAGQEHFDSEAFSAALWASRERIGPRLDAVVLGSLPLFANDVTLEEASSAILTVADEQVATGEWSAEERELLFRAFEIRGLIDCPRVIGPADEEREPLRWYLRQNSEAVVPFYPGPVQMQIVIPEGSDNIVLQYDYFPRGNSIGQRNESPVESMILVRRGDAIHYSYQTIEVNGEEDEDGEIDVREVIEVAGDWQIEVSPTSLGEFRRMAIVRGFAPGDLVTVAMVNLSYESRAVADGITLTSVPTEDLNGGSPTPSGAVDGEGTDVSEQVFGVAEDGGCACALGTAPGGEWWGAGLLFLGFRRRRRDR